MQRETVIVLDFGLGFILIYKKITLVQFSNSVIFAIILLALVILFSFYPPNLSFFI